MISVGIVGAGDIVRKMHLPVLQSLEGVAVTWLYDAMELRARAVGDAYRVAVATASAPRDLPDCDVALLAVPVPARAAYLRHFADRGIAVFCEKPFALTADEHRGYLQWFEPHRLACGYTRRFYASTRIVASLLAHGWLGALRAIRVGEGGRTRGSGGGQSFLDDPRFAAAGGVLMDLGTHTLDLALQFAGAGDFSVERSALTLDGEVDRHAEARVRLANGIELDYTVSWLAPQPNRLLLEFERACVWMNVAPGARVFLGDPARPREALELTAPPGGAGLDHAATPNQAFALEWREFLEGLRSARESRISAHGALATTALAESIRVHATPASAGHA